MYQVTALRDPLHSPPEPRTDTLISVIVVSFNTRDLLRKCLHAIQSESIGVTAEILVVDNCSSDGSPEMVAAEFPEVRLIASDVNLGFARANNVAIRKASGRYMCLVNSDAFLEPGSLRRALECAEGDPSIGIVGARLIGSDGGWQPSARMFPSLVNELLTWSGFAARFPRSRLFGRPDRTWADSSRAADVDWVPGAFSLVRAQALLQVGLFDEDYFLYYEEVDLCRRFKAAGYKIHYAPDVVVVHLGGESARSVPFASRSRTGAQLTLWRARSGFLYYRKHHGWAAYLVFKLELWWLQLQAARNAFSHLPERRERHHGSKTTAAQLRTAWTETCGGRISPRFPW